MDLANLGNPPPLDNGRMVEERSRVDTHGGEHCAYVTKTYLRVQSCVLRGMAVILCDHNFALRCLSLSICFPPLSAVYYFLLRTVLCLRFFFPFYSALSNEWPFMKYASNYFSLCAVFACLSCITPPR